jgi:hypothetical protein
MELPTLSAQRAIAKLFAALPRKRVDYRAGCAAREVFAALDKCAPQEADALRHDVRSTKTAVRRWTTSHHLNSPALLAVAKDVVRQQRLTEIVLRCHSTDAFTVSGAIEEGIIRWHELAETLRGTAPDDPRCYDWINAGFVLVAMESLQFRRAIAQLRRGESVTNFLPTTDDLEYLQSVYGPLLVFADSGPPPADYQQLRANTHDLLRRENESKREWYRRLDEFDDLCAEARGSWRSELLKIGRPRSPRTAEWFVLRQVRGLTYRQIAEQHESRAQNSTGDTVDEDAIRKDVARFARVIGMKVRSLQSKNDRRPEKTDSPFFPPERTVSH